VGVGRIDAGQPVSVDHDTEFEPNGFYGPRPVPVLEMAAVEGPTEIAEHAD
jgi:hypothetical protein